MTAKQSHPVHSRTITPLVRKPLSADEPKRRHAYAGVRLSVFARLAMASTAMALAMQAEEARAACTTQYCWTGGAGNWTDAAGWQLNATPSAGNTATVGNGATVTIGTTAASSNAIVDGGSTLDVASGATWTNNGSSPGFNQQGGAIIVGQSGTGALTVDNGGTVSTTGSPAGTLTVGNLAGSTGTVTVGNGGVGTASLINNGPNGLPGNLYIGYAGNGSLTINANGVVSGFDGATLGMQTGSQGTLKVNGGSFSDTLSSIAIGVNGLGTLMVENGGSATSLQATIASGVGSNGSSATVTGSGSSWALAGQLRVGGSGSGALTIADGGVVTLATYLNTQSQIYVGGGTASGSLVVNGGALNASAAQMLLGGNSGGQATMLIENGGTVTATGISYIGSGNVGSASTATVMVTGAGSNWTTGTLHVANPGTHASLTVENGASLISGEVLIGDNALGGNNAVAITGPGTTWQSSSAILLGNTGNAGVGGGTGTLAVTAGAHVNATGNIDVGYSPDGGNGVVDAVTVDGSGSKVTSSGNVRVGYFGSGTMTISNGAVVANGEGSIGYSSTNAAASTTLFGAATPTNSVGSVLVTGAGSVWSNTSLIVGDNAAIAGYSGTGAGTASGTLTVANGGQVTSTNAVVVAANNGTTGTINIGAAAGQAATAPGTIVAPAIRFGSGLGSIVFNHTSSNYVFDAPIQGNGTVDLENGTTTLAGASSYTGATRVNGGTLNVAGSLSGTANVTVYSGVVLTGAGSIASPQVLIGSGAVFAPGTPSMPGTSMAISGNLGFQAGATYSVYLNPLGATSANVTGTASLNGTVAAYFQPGSYLSKTYDILHAAGLGGTTFSGFTVMPANFNASLSYDATDVFLNLTAQMGASGNLNGNQRNVANVLDHVFNSTGSLPPAFASVFAMSGPALGNALSQLSGQAATGASGTAFESGSAFLDLLLDRAVDAGSSLGNTTQAFGYAADTRATLAPDIANAFARVQKQTDALVGLEQRWNIWGAAYGGSALNGGDGGSGASGTRTATTGLAVGAEYRLSPRSLFGVVLAGDNAGWRLSNGFGGGESNGFQAGLYGNTWFGPAYVAGSLSFANHWFSTDRTALGTQLTSSFIGQSYGARIEGGYRFDVAPTFAVTPYGSLQIQDSRTPAYAENSAGSFGLAYASANTTDVRTELGVRLETKRLLLGTPLLLSGRFGWDHQTTGAIDAAASFQALSGTDFVVSGTPFPKDAALVTARAQWWLTGNWSVAAQVRTEAAPNAQSYSGLGELRFAW